MEKIYQKVTVSLSKEMMRDMKIAAANRYISVSALMRLACEKELRKERNAILKEVDSKDFSG